MSQSHTLVWRVETPDYRGFYAYWQTGGAYDPVDYLTPDEWSYIDGSDPSHPVPCNQGVDYPAPWADDLCGKWEPGRSLSGFASLEQARAWFRADIVERLDFFILVAYRAEDVTGFAVGRTQAVFDRPAPETPRAEMTFDRLYALEPDALTALALAQLEGRL